MLLARRLAAGGGLFDDAGHHHVTGSAAPFKLNLASGLFRERAAGGFALALRRLVGRHIGLRLVFVRLRFLIFLHCCPVDGEARSGKG
jgi:hypothetical protein